jgi:23S rRNA (cytosine1962-C5)-methyltransferase
MATVRLKKGRLKAVHPRNPVIYTESIGKVRGNHEPGDIVDVQDHNGDFIGRGTFNTKADKAIRILSRKKTQAIDATFFRSRIQAAFLARKAVGVEKATDAYRIVNSEGDFLPGLIIDRYGDNILLQIETAGMNRFATDIVNVLWELFEPKAIIGRPDLSSMEVEGYQADEGLLKGDLPTVPVIIRENDLSFAIDILDGQSTGFYLHHRDNRLRTAGLCKGQRVLDCFTYSGAFALYAGKRGQADQVYGIESSAMAMDLAGKNLELNDVDNVVILQGEVFWELQNLVNRQELFDVVVVDPPRLITSWKTIEKGIQTYKVLNTLVLMIVRPNGILITCSSSEILEEGVFETLLAECAMESGRDLRIFARCGPAVDHPKHPACPRTRSLHCYFTHVT